MSGTSEGEASNRAHGITHTPGEHPQMNPGNIVEGDGRTEWEVHALRGTARPRGRPFRRGCARRVRAAGPDRRLRASTRMTRVLPAGLVAVAATALP